MRFASLLTVDRHGLRPRDDKVGKEWGCAVRFQHDLCHCEERAERRTRQSTACNGRVRRMRFAHWFTVDRHGLSALAMTRLWSDGWYGMVVCASMTTPTMSLRGKSGAIDAAIHWVQWARTGNAERFPTHSGSPRATPSR